MTLRQEKNSLACSDTRFTVVDRESDDGGNPSAPSTSLRRTVFSGSSLSQLPFQLLPQRVHTPQTLDKLLAWQEQFAEHLPNRPRIAVISLTAERSGKLAESVAVQSFRAAAFLTDPTTPIIERLAGLASLDLLVFAAPGVILHPTALFVLAKELLHGREVEELADLYFANELCLQRDGMATYFRKEDLASTKVASGSRYSLLGVNYFEDFVALTGRAVQLLLREGREKLLSLELLPAALQPLALAQAALALGLSAKHIPLGLSCRLVGGAESRGAESNSEALVTQGKTLDEKLRAGRLQLAKEYARQIDFPINDVKEVIWEERLFLDHTPRDIGGRVQIVIPFRDQIPLTLKCLDSLLSQTIVGDLVITLVNNNSSDYSLAELQQWIAARELPFASLVTVTDRGYFNFARLNNLGIAQSNTPFVLLLNNDVELQDRHSLAVLRAWCALPDIALVGGHLRYPSGATQHAGINFSPFGPLNLSLPEHCTLFSREVNGVTFAMAMAKRCLLEEVGGLDELRCPNGFGDALVAHELSKRGYRVIYSPAATGVHHESASRGASPEELERYEMARAGISIPCHFEDFDVVAQPMFLKPHALAASPAYLALKRLAGNARLKRGIMRIVRGVDSLLPRKP